MSDSNKAFNEVRALLNKLDRSIDEARTKRVGPETPAQGGTRGGTPGGDAFERGSSDLDQRIGGGRPAPSSEPAPESPMQAKRSQYGRARPLNRPGSGSGEPEASENKSAWQSPKSYDDLRIG